MTLALLLSLRIEAPWQYIHDDNGAWTQAVATAHLKAGVARTRGQDFLLRRDGALVPYLHHPPLYPLLMAAAYRLTGRSDNAVTRAVPGIFHLLGFVGLVVLARRLFPRSRERRILAAWLYAVVPMSAFFGKMPFNEPVGLCWVIWAAALTCAHRQAPRGAVLLGACLLWALGAFTSWPAFSLLLGFCGLFVWEAASGARSDARRAALALGATGLISGGLVVAQLFWAARGATPGLFSAAGHWGLFHMRPPLALSAFGRALDFHRIYFANAPWLLFVIWMFLRLARARSGLESPDEPTRVLLAGTLGAAVWALVFLRQVALHAYGQFWFLPFESLAVADIGVKLWERWETRPRARAVVAGAALVATLLSTVFTLHYRYGKPHGYAVRAARDLTERFQTNP